MRLILCIWFALLAHGLLAQYGGPRLFVDIPYFYLHAPDIERLSERVGAGLEAAMNVGAHWGVTRLAVGTTFTLNPSADDFAKTTLWRPYALMEAGAGLYRSNGNRCAKSHQSAFTAMGKMGVRYDFHRRAVAVSEGIEPSSVDFLLGVELGYFFIRDVFRNTEFVLNGNYHTQAKVISLNAGLKMFLNLRANR
ncbi:MAG: hypothetical protein NZM43_04235 [Saprospiraceae bacterium]|nr:hypothetical protein [Saprospiraceae bacterium]MDW8483516.1 hypothetical protein [Saprospiraceae bacterium]